MKINWTLINAVLELLTVSEYHFICSRYASCINYTDKVGNSFRDMINKRTKFKLPLVFRKMFLLSCIEVVELLNRWMQDSLVYPVPATHLLHALADDVGAPPVEPQQVLHLGRLQLRPLLRPLPRPLPRPRLVVVGVVQEVGTLHCGAALESSIPPN